MATNPIRFKLFANAAERNTNDVLIITDCPLCGTSTISAIVADNEGGWSDVDGLEIECACGTLYTLAVMGSFEVIP